MDKKENLHKNTMEDMTVNKEADAIWKEIANLKLDIFSLPNQTVSMHAVPETVEPSALYLNLKSTSVLPALETALGKLYTVEVVGRFTKITKNK